MKNNCLVLILSLLIVFSCSVETNLAKLTESAPKESIGMNMINLANVSVEKTKYTSELTNSIDGIKEVENYEINRQNKLLHFYVTDYIYAMKEQNWVGKDKAYVNIQKCTKKLQKLKTGISQDDKDWMDRYLTKIKTNITMLESMELKEN